uniref:Myb-like domain-containing protein n=1 Tax=Chenopodium quinoa TaxID=63459 RepID=A0A803LNB3_CHEQI
MEDDKGNGSRYISKTYGQNDQQEYGSSLRPKGSGFSDRYPRESNQYPGDEEEDIEDEELGEEDVERNGVRMIGKDTYDDEEDEEEEGEGEGEDEEEEDDSDDEEDDDNDDHEDGKRFNGKAEDISNGKPRKKRKLKTIISNYEFAPRVPTPTVQKATLPQAQPTSSGQNSVGDWTEKETFALLDAWGERFLRLGRKSLRSDEWQEVAEKVSQETNVERTDAQCRNRLDTLKKKYKKESTRLTAGGSGVSQWVFYRRMDMLLSSSHQQTGLSCGIDSGEYVFMNSNVYLNRANGLDEMRDSPGNSDYLRDEDGDDSDGLPPKGKKNKGRRVDGSSVQLLADSIEKFSERRHNMDPAISIASLLSTAHRSNLRCPSFFMSWFFLTIQDPEPQYNPKIGHMHSDKTMQMLYCSSL